MQVAIEAKSARRVDDDDLEGLLELARDHTRIERRVIVCLDDRARRTDDGIELLPWRRCADLLAGGELFA